MNGKLVLSFTLAVSSFASISSFASSQQVVRSRVTIPISMGANSHEATAGQGIEIVNAATSSITLDASKFVIPTVSNAPLAFGSLSFATLFDNNLNVCGPANNQRCNTATIRLYTTGAGPGIFNAADGYGMPLTFNTNAIADDVVGFGPENAITVQTLAIDPTHRTVRLSDFGTLAKYNFNSDFTDAGAGSFATTIVFEYVLSLVP